MPLFPEGAEGNEMELYVCGCRGSFPVSGAEHLEFGGATTCYVLRRGDYAVVIDCGTGLRNAGAALAGCKAVDVLLTHMHYDHILGLLMPGSFPADAELRIISAFDQWEGQETLRQFLKPPFWPVTPELGELVSVRPPESIALRDGFTMEIRDSFHPGAGILIKLKIGETSVCFLWDYERGCDDLDEWIQSCDLVCYDGMFDDDEYPDHVGWGHSTWQEGCRLAQRSCAKRLLITHHAPEHGDDWLRQAEKQSVEIFANTRFAREGDVIQLGEDF